MSIATVNKWGNSAAVRLPIEALQQAHLKLGEKVSISVKGGAIVIRRAGPKKRYTLDELLAASPKSPAAWPRDEDWLGDAPVGRESL
ncbi:MAG TPA: AbrB/MazE/SpoVT family DNA-binding domain-containing protein [Rudaea sp.]|nr:AbrB/MazE/SpoVT family DNA-binding domain-containing protein [Rudaea sp.]